MSSTPPSYVPFLTVEQTIIAPISTLSAMYFVYGIYVLLFGTYIYMIRSGNRTGEGCNSNLYPVLTVVLFVLSSIFVVNFTVYMSRASFIRFNVVKDEDHDLFERYQNMDDFGRRFGYATENFVAAFLNVAAEWMLIHRCYRIWGSSRAVAIPLIVVSVIMNALGLVASILFSVTTNALAMHNPAVASLMGFADDANTAYIAGSAGHNLIITLLTAGRIWWINRQVHAHRIYTSDKFIQSISRCIFESGMLYPLMSLVNLIIVNTIIIQKIPFDPFPLVALSAGIAPTLIMVRAKLGMNIETMHETLSNIRFSTLPAQRSRWLGGNSTVQSQVPQVVSAGRNSGGGVQIVQLGCEPVDNVKETSMTV